MSPEPASTICPRFWPRFKERLAYWSLHCSLNALPSFGIACFYLDLLKNPSAVMAMLADIATFVLLYATLTSLQTPFADQDHPLARALRIGTKIRGWISALSVVAVASGAGLLTPDFWCGWLAISILGSVAKLAPASGMDYLDAAGFARTYLTTVLEGLILSFFLLLFSFLALIVLQARARKNAFINPSPRHPGGI